MEGICDKCGGKFKNIGAHLRFCKAMKKETTFLPPIPSEPSIDHTRPIGKLKRQLENNDNDDIAYQLKKLSQRIESMDAEKDIEGYLDIQVPDEQKSGMYIIDKHPKEITGDATEAILKSRFKDYHDAQTSIEKFVQRYYSTLENTRYGGDSILIPCDEIENGVWNMDDLKKFSSWHEIETIKDRDYIRVFIEMASIRETLSQVARIGSSDGKARLEDIHKAGARAEGQAYVEAHTPPPDMYPKKYIDTGKKIEAAATATLEPLDETK